VSAVPPRVRPASAKNSYTRARVHIRVYIHVYISVYITRACICACYRDIRVYIRVSWICDISPIIFSLLRAIIALSRYDPLVASPRRKGVRELVPRSFTGVCNAVVTFDRAANSPSDTLSSERRETHLGVGGDCDKRLVWDSVSILECTRHLRMRVGVWQV